MDIHVEHDEGEDFGKLILTPGRDDYIEVSGYGDGSIKIQVPLYNYEARELIEKLGMVAEAPTLD